MSPRGSCVPGSHWVDELLMVVCVVKRYYRHDAESEFGLGVAYMEITDGWPTRQVEAYGEVWFWGDEVHNRHLADQPFARLGLTADHEISECEFERVWEEARRRCPRPS